jgi:archaellum component FlaC
MEKDVDEVGKIARSIKSKLEELDKEVGQLLLLFSYRFTAF